MRRRAFTLVEIMLVAAIFATLSVAVFTCLSNGIKLWDRANSLQGDGDVLIFIDRFSADLRNTFTHSKLEFSGTEMRFAFPTVVVTSADRVSVRADEVLVDQLGRVMYAYDPERALLLRRQANYSQALGEVWGPEEIVAARVAGARFHYFYAGSRDPRAEADPDDGIPSGVEIEIMLMQRAGAEAGAFRRYVAVPTGV